MQTAADGYGGSMKNQAVQYVEDCGIHREETEMLSSVDSILGIGQEDAVGLIVNGYAKEVLAKLPMEFAVEAQKLLSVSLEGSVG